MGATTLISLLSVASVLMLPGDEPAWRRKAIPQGDDQDARTILAESPWVRNVKLEKVRDLSKFERRDGGNWEAGVPQTLGPLTVDGLRLLESMFDPRTAELAKELAHRLQPDLGSVWVRWESALPVRAAEMKTGEGSAPLGMGATTPLPSMTWSLHFGGTWPSSSKELLISDGIRRST
jgi:hypothetical protein